jgi:hypothetical protein
MLLSEHVIRSPVARSETTDSFRGPVRLNPFHRQHLGFAVLVGAFPGTTPMRSERRAIVHPVRRHFMSQLGARFGDVFCHSAGSVRRHFDVSQRKSFAGANFVRFGDKRRVTVTLGQGACHSGSRWPLPISPVRRHDASGVAEHSAYICCAANDRCWGYRAVIGSYGSRAPEVCSWRSAKYSRRPLRHLTTSQRRVCPQLERLSPSGPSETPFRGKVRAGSSDRLVWRSSPRRLGGCRAIWTGEVLTPLTRRHQRLQVGVQTIAVLKPSGHRN